MSEEDQSPVQDALDVVVAVKEAVLGPELNEGHTEVSPPETSGPPVISFSGALSSIESILKTSQEGEASGSSSLDLLDRVLQEIVQQTGASVVLFFRYSAEARAWSLLASSGMPVAFGKPPLSRSWQSLPILVCKEGPLFLSENITRDRLFVGQMIRGTTAQAFVGIAVCVEGNPVGSLCLGWNHPNAFTEKDCADLSSLAGLLGPFFTQPEAENSVCPTETVTETISEEKPVPPPVIPIPVETKTPQSGVSAEAPSPPQPPIIQEGREAVEAERVSPQGVQPLQGAPAASVIALESKSDVRPPTTEMRPPPKERPSGSGRPPRGQRGNREERPSSAPASGSRTAETGTLPSGADDLKVALMEALFSALASVFQKEDFSKEVLRKIISATKADSGTLFQWDRHNKRLFPVAVEGILGDAVKRIEKTWVKPDLIWGKVIDRNQSLLISFEMWKSPLKKKLFGEENFRSQVTVPIPFSDGVWGLLSLFHKTQSFSQKELKLLEFAGCQIGSAFDAVSLWNETQSKMDQLVLAQHFNLDITKGASVVFSSLLNGMAGAIRASNAYLLLLDEKRRLLRGIAGSKLVSNAISEVEIRMDGESLAPLTVKEGHPIVVENALSDPRVGEKWIDHFRSRSIFSVPLILKDRVMGVLLFDETAYIREFAEEEIQTIVSLSHSAALSIETAIQYQDAVRQRDRQEHLSSAILRTHEEERRGIATTLEHETTERLERARKSLKEAKAALPEFFAADSEARKHVEDATSELDKAIEGLKIISSDLHPSVLEKQGLIAAISAYVERFSKTNGLAIQWAPPSGVKRAAPGLELLLYRTVQEALTNVSQHANSKSAILTMEKNDLYWQFSVTDAGDGFDAKKYFLAPQSKRKGTGILGMKGRVEQVGGTFFIESELQQGTRVSIKVPIMKK
jgi:signal transduction histidine kinase